MSWPEGAYINEEVRKITRRIARSSRQDLRKNVPGISRGWENLEFRESKQAPTTSFSTREPPRMIYIRPASIVSGAGHSRRTDLLQAPRLKRCPAVSCRGPIGLIQLLSMTDGDEVGAYSRML